MTRKERWWVVDVLDWTVYGERDSPESAEQDALTNGYYGEDIITRDQLDAEYRKYRETGGSSGFLCYSTNDDEG